MFFFLTKILHFVGCYAFYSGNEEQVTKAIIHHMHFFPTLGNIKIFRNKQLLHPSFSPPWPAYMHSLLVIFALRYILHKKDFSV